MLGPIVNMIGFVAGDPFLICCDLREIVLFVPICSALWKTARNLIKRRRLLAHVVELQAELRIGLCEVTLEPKRVHVSDFDTGLPFVQTYYRALDSFTLTMIIKCVRLRSYFHIVS